MTDDNDDLALLKQLGARAREQRAEAAAKVPALDAAAEERIAARLLEKVRDSLPHEIAERKLARASLPPRAKKSPVRWLYAAAPLAAAAALALLLSRRGNSIVAPPAYELSMVSVSDMRDPSSAKIDATDYVLDPAGELELVARPVAPMKDTHARAFLVRSGDAQPWLVPLQVSDDGAVRISGMTRVLFPTTNQPYDVVIFVAAGDVLPSDDDARRIALGAGDAAPAPANFRVIRGHVRFMTSPQEK